MDADYPRRWVIIPCRFTIVAELSAQALCRIVGKQQDTTGNSYRYIEHYAKKINLSPWAACLKVMAETEKVLNLILDGNLENKKQENSSDLCLAIG